MPTHEDVTPADIAAQIDTSTADGHNLRALLLRLGDGDKIRQPGLVVVIGLLVRAQNLGLVDTDHTCCLTTLGGEVVELLRPFNWWTSDEYVYDSRVTSNSHGPHAAECASAGLAERIAELLTTADIDAAKRYRTT